MSSVCQKRRGQETRSYGTNNTTYSSTRDALECRALGWGVRGAWRGGTDICQAEGVREKGLGAGTGHRGKKEGTAQVGKQVPHPER